MNELLDYALRLGLLCGLSGGLLGWVHSKTAPIKEARQLEEREEAKREVFPLPVGGRFEQRSADGLKYARALDSEGDLVGCVFTAKGSGYGGALEIMVGMDLDGTLRGAQVMSQKETPGSGAKIEEMAPNWFSDGNVEDLSLARYGGAVDAISGATITSEAAVRAVRETGMKVRELLEKEGES